MPTNPDPTHDILGIARRLAELCDKTTQAIGPALETLAHTAIELRNTLSTFEAQRSGMTPQPPAEAETPEARKAREAKEERDASERFQQASRQHR